MLLPILNATPKYEMRVPSTQLTVKFRPYLVKEDKIILLAGESNDHKAIMDAVVSTLAACIDGDFDTKTLTTFDVEYLFAKIRAKSVGETADVLMRCSECSEYTEVKVNIDEISVNIPEGTNKIQITDQVAVQLKWPTYSSISDDSELLNDKKSETSTIKLLAHCIDNISTEEEIWKASDISKDEISEFIDSMTAIQFEKVKAFVDSIPEIEKDIEFKCEKCGKDNKTTLKGSSDFF